MPLPWLQDVDPAELLPDDTKWEDYDEFTLWKQCKLRGLDGLVRKDGDALRLLNDLNRPFEVTWLCYVRSTDPKGVEVSNEAANEKALAWLIEATGRQTFQILGVEEHRSNEGSPEMVIEMSDATVTLYQTKKCNCAFIFWVGMKTCRHILFADLEVHVLRCSKRLHSANFIYQSDFKEYFANAPPAFRPKGLLGDQYFNDPVSGRKCQLCFKTVEHTAAGDIKRCQVCCRVAHQQCHKVYLARKAVCEGDTGCPLCCPRCPWNPSNRELKAEPHSLTTKEESTPPDVKSETIEDDTLAATERKNWVLEKKIRKPRGQLHGQRRRKSASRTMTDRQYKRLIAKVGGRVGRRRNKETACKIHSPTKDEPGAKEETPKHMLQDQETRVDETVKEGKCVKVKEESRAKDERPTDISQKPRASVEQTAKEEKPAKMKEELEPEVEFVKIEPRAKVKSEAVVISLL